MPYIVYDLNTNEKICETGTLDDAMALSTLHSNRGYRKINVLNDQVIDVLNTYNKQLSPIKLNPQETPEPLQLPESHLKPL